MENDVRPAAAFLEQMAPTQTHENRRNFLLASRMLKGPDINSGYIAYVYPVWEGDKQIGWADVTFQSQGCEGEDPIISTKYEKFVDNEEGAAND